MSKRIIAVALCLVAVAFAFAACGKNEYEKDETTTLAAVVEYSTEENGDVFVTSINGEHIPVTTDKDGNAELYVDLITKTQEQVSKETESIHNKETAPSDKQPDVPTPSTTIQGVSVEAGDAVIDFR